MFNTGLFFKNGKPIAHRSLLKIFLNPLLRKCFGIAIASFIENDKFVKYIIIKQKPLDGSSKKV